MTLAELKLHIENMYDQLDPATIDNWDVEGLEVITDEGTFILAVKEAA